MNSSLTDALVSLGPGESTYSLSCPKCGTPPGNKGSFCVTKLEDGRGAYICFRASCGYKGFVDGHSIVNPSIPIPKFKPNAYSSPTVELPEEVLSLLKEKYSLNKKVLLDAQIKYNNNNHCLVIPVISMGNVIVALIERALWKRKPKVLTFKLRDVPCTGYFGEAFPHSVIIVEDWASALRLHQSGINALYLNGTHLHREDIHTLVKQRVQTVVVTLDEDANDKGAKMVKRLRGAVPNVIQVPLLSSPDIKDMTNKQFEDYINHLVPFNRS